MQLPPVKRLLSEDFPDQTKWISKLLQPLNQLFQSLATGLKNGLTFEENIAAQIRTVTFNNNTAEFPLVFKNTLSKAPVGCWVIGIDDVSSSPQALSGAVFITSRSYDPQNNQHKVNSLSGLVSGQQYRITFLLI